MRIPRWSKILFAVVTLALAAWIAYAIATHVEAGLMSACKLPDGRYDYAGNCFPVRMLTEQIPIGITLVVIDDARGYSTKVAGETLERAIQTLNNQIGCEVFTSNLSLGLPYVTATFNVDPDAMASKSGLPDDFAQVSHQMVGNALYAQIDISSKKTPQLYAGLLHELGHVVGLAHDAFADSIMFERSARDYHRFTDSDRTLIFNMYCKKTLR